jgi:hypothetical protein
VRGSPDWLHARQQFVYLPGDVHHPEGQGHEHHEHADEGVGARAALALLVLVHG